MKAPLITAEIFGATFVTLLQTGEDQAVSSCFHHFSEAESKHNILGQLYTSLKRAWFLVFLEKENVAWSCIPYN